MSNKRKMLALTTLLQQEGYYIRHMDYSGDYFYIKGRDIDGIEFDIITSSKTIDDDTPYINYVIEKIKEQTDSILREKDLMMLTKKELDDMRKIIDRLRQGYENNKETVFIFGVDTPNNSVYKREFRRQFDKLVESLGELQTSYRFMGRDMPLTTTVMKTDLTKKSYKNFQNLGFNVVGMIDE